jgi:hypothetical protein
MSEKVTLEYLKKYATEFCALTLSNAYRQKETLNGHELLKLTPIRKINQHIVGRLSAHWNGQIQTFNSPYFDFNSDEVKSALEHFSNVVSQHISLRKDHLQPWLQDVVEKTLAPLASVSALSEAEEEMVRQFSTIHPLEIAKPEPTFPVATPAKTISFFQLIDEEKVEEPATAVSARVEPVSATIEPPAQPAAKPADKPVSQPITTRPEPLNARFQVELPEVSSDVAYGSVRIKLENIGQSISLAQRFMFVGQLFKGDFDAFSQSIGALDSAETFTAAHQLITESLAPTYGWDLKSEAVVELVSLVKRKFN